MTETTFRRPVVHPDDLAGALDAIESALDVRLRETAVEALPAADQRQLVALAKTAELDRKDRKALLQLVERAAPGLVQAAREAREARARRVEAFRAAATRPARVTPLPAGWAALPSEVLDDVFSGKLLPIDLPVLVVAALAFTTGRTDPYRAGHGDVRWDGEALVVRDDGRALLQEWDAHATENRELVISRLFASILKRLADGGWLDVSKPTAGQREVRLLPGRRLGHEFDFAKP